IRDGGVSRVAPPGRPADRLRPRGAQDVRAAAPDLRPDARAEVGDRDGRMRELRRDVQQLLGPAGGRQDRAGRHPRSRLSAAPGGADGGHRPAAREGDGRRSARLRDPRGRKLTVPGLIERREQHGETTVVVDPARLLEAAVYLRDTEGFRFLSDIAATDYLGWGETPI